MLPLPDSSRWSLPWARLVRERAFDEQRTAIPVRDRVLEWLTPFRKAGRATAHHLIGLWPLFVIAGLAAGLLWSAGFGDSP